MTTISGVTYDECRANAETHDVDGLQVPVISREDLKKNKRALGATRISRIFRRLPCGSQRAPALMS